MNVRQFNLSFCGVLLFMFLFSCKTEPTVSNAIPERKPSKEKRSEPIVSLQWDNYKIRKGEHQNDLNAYRLMSADSVSFHFSFDSTVVYNTSKRANQEDWNKLFGFSDCGSHHQKNSVRLVWRWTPHIGIELGEYYYLDKTRSYNPIDTIQPGDTILCSMFIKDRAYHIFLNSEVQRSKERNCSNRFLSYYLYPYFGGDEASSKDINIFMAQTYP